MKKSILSFLLAPLVFSTIQAQTITNYGTGSGTMGSYGSYFGYEAGSRVNWTGAGGNSFFGYGSGKLTTSGQGNTAIGYTSLHSNTTGNDNTAIGASSLQSNYDGHGNTATGNAALWANWDGDGNTANGKYALYYNRSGNYNVAVGSFSLRNNSEGDYNTAVGVESLFQNVGGTNSVAIGYRALYANTIGGSNVAVGNSALTENVSGVLNTAVGQRALYNNVTGGLNTAVGYNSGPSTSTPNLYNTTALGYHAIPTASDQVRIGNTSVRSIGGQVSWSTLSDGRFKRDIKEDVSGLEFIKKLRPVSYTVDADAVNKFLRIPDSLQSTLRELRLAPKRQTGFVAQEVEAIVKKTGYVFHGVEAPQNENDHYSIRYAEFVVPLVKAVQELTAKVELQEKNAIEQEKFAIEQKEEIQSLKEQLKLIGQSTYDDPISKTETVLYQNKPNPFTLDTEIRMSLPETSRQATLMIYNLEGKQLKVLPITDRGNTQVKIQGNELKAGMYIYSLIIDGKVVDTKRMILTGN